jgi:two-component system, cell cycle sensor histidine kinase and response regulator CckA
MKPPAPTQTKGAGRTILVVDDDAPILHCIRRTLERANYVVLTSPSGDHAWSVIERGDARADLVLADVVMPGSIDGLALAARIRQREPKLPVLFMTGAALEDFEYLVESTRNRLVLRKPFNPQQLIDFIDSSFLLWSQA